MYRSIEADLERALREVVETMCFAMVLQRAEYPQTSGQEVALRVSFRGGESGEMHIRMESAAAEALAAGFLGRDTADLTGEEVRQVAGELSNMICGCFLSNNRSDLEFEISTPELDPPPANLPGAAEQAFLLDSGCIQLSFATANG